MMPARRFTQAIESPLEGVSSDAWRQFIAALEVQPIGSVSKSGGLGSYDIRPRRLVELGYAKGLRSLRSDGGRQIHACDFVAPWTKLRFLCDPVAQYTVLVQSVRLYYNSLLKGEIQLPEGVGMSGALAVLQRGGKGALKSLVDGKKLFEHTQALYESAKGAF